MKWEKCKRCGSNRVVNKSSGGTGIKLLFISFVLLGIGNTMNEEINIFFIIPLILGVMGISLLLFSGRLVCKDCEISWVPGKT